jgi:transmembrane sensor
MKNKPEHIDEVLLLKVLESRADENEKALFKSWLEESDMHAEIFEQFKKTYQLTSIDPDSLKRNWDTVASKFKSGKGVPEYVELPGTAQPFAFKLKLNAFMRVAAMFIILLGISFLFKIIVFDSEQLTISGNDMNPTIPYQLADGSLVYLNKNSEISFPKKFGTKNRKLTLTGEAFFEVNRNEKIPFVISTYKTTIRVLGTKFNVYSDISEQVKVSVTSGLVEFYTTESKDKVKLSAGENGIYNPGMASVKKEKNTDLNFLAWKTNIFYFNNTPLPDAFRLLQEQYKQVFVFDVKHGDIPTLTTTFDNVPLEAVLEELNLLLNTKNVTRNDTIFFKPNSL